MAVPEQMYAHALDMLKGWHDMHSVDYSAKASPDVEFDINSGRVCALDADGDFVPGIEDTDMAIFIHRGSGKFDVENPGGTDWYPVNPSGEMAGLVACQGYELQSTEFDAEEDYAPNDPLTAARSLSDADVGGLLKPGTVYTDPICGVVSRGKVTNAHRVEVLTFWTVWLPPTPA